MSGEFESVVLPRVMDFLGLRDLVQCVRVSHAWNVPALDQLYAVHFPPNSRLKDGEWIRQGYWPRAADILMRHGHRVRRLDVSRTVVATGQSAAMVLLLCPNVVNVELTLNRKGLLPSIKNSLNGDDNHGEQEEE